MSKTTRPSVARATLPLRSDPTSLTRRSLDTSPSRSSVRSSSSQSQTHTPASSIPDTPRLLTRPSSPEGRPLHAADSNSFLTRLAAQERRVLELREELHKANEDLEKLKKQWAVHEATKEKDELRHSQQLQPLKKSMLGSGIQSIGHVPAYASRDMDRRKITSSIMKSSHRKVFAGSRHTRALSLLSSKDPGSHSGLLSQGSSPLQVDKNAAIDIAVAATLPEPAIWNIDSSLQKDVIMETGKQLVGDFRHGLWTFFEDFKQLTVGDEGIGTTSLRHSPTLSSASMLERPNPKAKMTIPKECLARKSGALDPVREPWRKPSVKACGHDQRVSRALERSFEAVGPTSNREEVKFTSRNGADSSDSDANGWNNWDTRKKPSSQRKDLVDGADPTTYPLVDKSSLRVGTR